MQSATKDGSCMSGSQSVYLRGQLPGSICALILAVCFCATGRAAAPGASPGPAEWHAMGATPCLWPVPIQGPSHELEVETMLRRLKAVGAQCYSLVITGMSDSGVPNAYSDTLDDLERLLPAAQAAGIAVIPVLLSPADGGSLPYKKDYVKWMEVLAGLSLKYPALRGVNIDDTLVGGNDKVFTRAYLTEIYEAKQKINPRFLFFPCVYDLGPAVANLLAGRVDGVWLSWVNLDTAKNLEAFIENTKLAVAGRFPVYVNAYARWTSWHEVGGPSPQAYRKMLDIICRHADGAFSWNVPLDKPNPYLDVLRSFATGGSSPVAGRCGLIHPSTPRAGP